MNMVLHQVVGAWGTPSVSPFCTKLQCWLRMAGVPYTVAPQPDMLRSPRGKVPFVDLDGERISDSQAIIDTLAARLGDPLDGWLAPAQRATAHLVRRTLEEATYFHLAWDRWEDDAGFAAYRPVFEGLAPVGLKWLMPVLIRRNVRAQLQAQGTGRRARDEIHRLAIADFAAVAAVLGDKPFVCGDRPCTADATLFAFVDGTLAFPTDGPVKAAVAADARLVGHRDRVRARWFADA